MSNIVDELYNAIEAGRKGKNIGISTGLPKIDDFIGGIQKKTYYLLMGTSGAGKSSYALYSFIYRPLKDNPNGNFKIVYFSLEMSARKLLAKLLSLYLYETYSIVIPYKKLMSWQEILDSETYNYVLKGKEWLNEITKKLVIYDKSLNRDSFYRTMMNVLEDEGRFEESEDGFRKIYIPNDPDKLILGVLDHVNLSQPKPGEDKKSEIDAISARAVRLREVCGASFLFIQQENRNSASMDRRKADMTECSSEDLKDTGNTFNDCEVCIGVYFPLKHKLKTCHEYVIINDIKGDSFKGLRDRYRGLCLIKNREGESEKYVSVNFFGEIGLFRELPKADTISDYSPYMRLNRHKEENSEDEVLDKPKKELIYSF